MIVKYTNIKALFCRRLTIIVRGSITASGGGTIDILYFSS